MENCGTLQTNQKTLFFPFYNFISLHIIWKNFHLQYEETAQPREFLTMGWNSWLLITASRTYLLALGPINRPYNGFIAKSSMNTTVMASTHVSQGTVPNTGVASLYQIININDFWAFHFSNNLHLKLLFYYCKNMLNFINVCRVHSGHLM